MKSIFSNRKCVTLYARNTLDEKIASPAEIFGSSSPYI